MVEVIAGRLSDSGAAAARRPHHHRGDRPSRTVEDRDTVRLELEHLGAVELSFGA
jgi:hypothetical protein